MRQCIVTAIKEMAAPELAPYSSKFQETSMRASWMNRQFVAIAVAIAGSAALGAAPIADASTVPVNNGGALNLTVTSSGNNNSANAANGDVSAPATPGTFTYGNAFTSQQTVNFGATGVGFYDDYVFTIGAGQVDSITSSIQLANVLGISGLQVRLYDYTANGSIAPLLTTPVPGSAFDAWSSTTLFTGGSATVSVLPATLLDAGTYVIEVRGTASGIAGGSYTGSLNLVPVPLPAAMPLLLSGLGLLGSAARRRGRGGRSASPIPLRT